MEKSLTFKSLTESLSKATHKSIKKMNFTAMTEVQSNSILPLLAGKDVWMSAKTGSGKTLAYLIPVVELIERAKMSPTEGVGAIIISPTNELCFQIDEVLRTLLKDRTMPHITLLGRGKYSDELSKLTEGVNVLVATPSGLLSHLPKSSPIMTNNLKILVIDEADRLLDEEYEKTMERVFKFLPKKRQNILASAIKDIRIRKSKILALKKNILEVDLVTPKEQVTADGLEQSYVNCPSDKRFLALHFYLKKFFNKKVMVFFNSCNTVKYHHELLHYLGFSVKAIHGKKVDLKRRATYSEFFEAKKGTLLCTDLAARGWDIPNIDWIIHFEPPQDISEYIHRVGRTARAGGTGNALLFLRKEERGFVHYLRNRKVILTPIDAEWSNVEDVQPKLEDLVSKNAYFQSMAKKGFQSFILSYKTHHLDKFFRIPLDEFTLVAKSFGLSDVPLIKFKKKKDSTNQFKNKGITNQFKKKKDSTNQFKYKRNFSYAFEKPFNSIDLEKSKILKGKIKQIYHAREKNAEDFSDSFK